MNNKAYVLVGMLLGDEGKGSFIDYLTNREQVKQIIRYNGGCQASHTVISEEGTLHKFSQLGSGMFNEGCKTYLSSNMVVNPFALLEEIRQFSDKTKINRFDLLKRIYIDENCYIVTPYHKLINRLRELSNLYIRRGSVGTGVSEVPRLLNENNLGIQIKDLKDKDILHKKIDDLALFTKNFIDINKQYIDKELFDKLIDLIEIQYLLDDLEKEKLVNKYIELFSKIDFNICKGFSEFYIPSEKSIFEGSQGILLDHRYGLKPNTTLLDTTYFNAFKMLENKNDNIRKIGIIKGFASRHGMGVLPTENNQLQSLLFDENQRPSYWNGSPRNGWLDCVLLRYSQRINSVDELFLSSLDRLSTMPIIKICNSYKYKGNIDKEFERMFEYKLINGDTIITDINNNQGEITKYLNQCVPIYIDLSGWEKDISNITEYDKLPNQSKNYIELINELVGVETSVVSVGPTRKEKILVR